MACGRICTSTQDDLKTSISPLCHIYWSPWCWLLVNRREIHKETSLFMFPIETERGREREKESKGEVQFTATVKEVWAGWVLLEFKGTNSTVWGRYKFEIDKSRFSLLVEVQNSSRSSGLRHNAAGPQIEAGYHHSLFVVITFTARFSSTFSIRCSE